MVRLVVWVSFAAIALFGCNNDAGLLGIGGGSGNGGGGFGGAPVVCADLNAAPTGCGQTCGRDGDCMSGLFCAASSCFAQCTPSDPCNGTDVCSPRGRCNPMNGTGGSGGTGGDSCIRDTAVPNREIPNVMFLVDRSGSMDNQFDPPSVTDQRWEVAYDAIESVITSLDSIVRFGLTTYHWNEPLYGATNGAGEPSDPGDPLCPILNTVDFADMNATGILSNYSRSFPNDPMGGSNDTPTGDSIDALVAAIQANPPPATGPTIIALATDGEPDTCESPNPQNGQAEAVAAAKNAFDNAGIETFILSVGQGTVSQTHLDEMARVGIGKAADGSEGDGTPYVGDSPTQLENAFREIVTRNIVCEVTLDKDIQNVAQACTDSDAMVLLGDGVGPDIRLGCGGVVYEAGYTYEVEQPRTIRLLGTACDEWKAATKTEISFDFPCDTLVGPS